MAASVDMFAGGIRQTFINDKLGWTVAFQGSIDRTTEDITRFFGLNSEGLTPFEIHLSAAAQANAGQLVVEALEAAPVSAGASGETRTAPAPSVATTAGDPWAAAQADPPTPEPAPTEPRSPQDAMLDTIEATGDVQSLQRLWAENRRFFDDNAEVFAVWKARGKHLQASAQ
ncbi:hypothetical protein OG474_30410 [Kribbella sp. NBC_01505]|uniref:hypothetical protein n=1 Tax=Kribbella sp. NBC_01505 TaxID=2903580 RepID=UPI0038706208